MATLLLVLLLSATAATPPHLVTLEADVSTDVARTAPQWARVRRAGSGDEVRVTVVLRRDAAALRELEAAFWAVSDVTSPRYGMHLTQRQVTDIVAAPTATLETVTAWLRRGGATDIVANAHRDLLTVALPAPAAEALFHTELYAWRHTVFGGVAPIVRAAQPYAVPRAIGQLVAAVDGLLRFPLLDAPRSAAEAPEAAEVAPPANDNWPTDCGAPHGLVGGKYVTPGVLTARYNLGAPTATPARGMIGVFESQGEFWDEADLAGFGAACGVNASIDVVIGDNNPKKCSISPLISPPQCKESLLDVLTIKGICGAIPLTDVYNKDYDLMAWATQIGNMGDAALPLVQSVSYGRDESQETGDAFIQALNAEFMKLGARGVTVVAASGDLGTSGRRGSPKRFHAGFPASSPFVTAVGGTNFAAKNTVGDETAWGGSGGGFSDHFGVPSYQADAVSAFLALAAANDTFPDPSKYNATGRGFPDVACLGGSSNPYFIWNGGKKSSAYGTSAGTPVFAVVVAKLNELRFAAGKPAMGFINPFLYANAGPGGGFNDVTTGRNCGPEACGNKASDGGFPATVGWDAATGLGTPNFGNLAKLQARYF